MNSKLSGIVVGVTATAATVAARRAVEFGWREITGEEPPTSEALTDDADLRDLMVWSAVLIGAMVVARKVAASAAHRLVG